MFNAVAALVTASFQAPLAEAPQLPDHRTQFTINPLEVTDTREWKCSKDDKVTRLTVRTVDISAPNRNDTFKSEVVGLLVDGRAAKLEVQARVTTALAQPNTAPVLNGKCFGRIPVILLTGSKRVDGQYQAQRVEIPLR
jgi:hypothetical protein